MAIVNTVIDKSGISPEVRQAINDDCDSMVYTALRSVEFKTRENLSALIPEKLNPETSIEYRIKNLVREYNQAEEHIKLMEGHLNISTKELNNLKSIVGSNDIVNDLEISFLKKWIATANIHSDQSSTSNVYRNMEFALEQLESDKTKKTGINFE